MILVYCLFYFLRLHVHRNQISLNLYWVSKYSDSEKGNFIREVPENKQLNNYWTRFFFFLFFFFALLVQFCALTKFA